MADLTNNRENWGSRAGFILAAVGSAVGVGNIWRFPHEAYSNGGGAFLIPYILAIIVIGIPMLIMEFSLGHMTQQAAPNAFKKIGSKWEFVGWWPIVLSFVIVCYYSAVLAWCMNYLVDSFSNPLPWEGNAKDYFNREYLQRTEGLTLGGINWPIFGALAAVWGLMYLCICKGVKLLGKIVLWLVPLPFLMLIILLVRGLTMDGAILGLEYFLEPDWSVLKNVDVWRGAFAQVFFSMSLAFGVMVAYSSYLHRKSDLNNNALIIALCDLSASFLAGITVFATMGSVAYKTGQPVGEIMKDSVGLAFVAFPEALTHLPHSQIFSVIFFIALLILGIDSAFSITQAALSSMIDKTGWKRNGILLTMTLMGLGVGTLFCTRGGLAWLGTIDSFVNEGAWGILFIGLVECLVIGWCFDIGKLRRHSNKSSDWKIGVWWEWSIKLVVPGILGALFIWKLKEDFYDNQSYFINSQGELNGVNVFGTALMLILFLVAVILGLWRPGKKNELAEL